MTTGIATSLAGATQHVGEKTACVQEGAKSFDFSAVQQASLPPIEVQRKERLEALASAFR
jgi:hypothetical protein